MSEDNLNKPHICTNCTNPRDTKRRMCSKCYGKSIEKKAIRLHFGKVGNKNSWQ